MADRPAWWAENDRIRRSLDLPPYEPPRFADGTYTHEVVPDLEAEFDVELRFVGVDARRGDDWEVRVDGARGFAVGRRRDRNGNTVYELSADAFERRVRNALATE